jgi:hypothetical protein
MNNSNKNILDSIWLWCHSAGSYNGRWEVPGESNISPVEAAAYFGIKNSIMVVFDNKPLPPFENYARQFSNMDKLVWSVIGDAGSKRNNDESDLQPVLNLKKSMPNLCGAIMDDFFGNGRDNLEAVKNIAKKLHTVGLELWVVLYDHQLDHPNLKEFLDCCDVINFWTWRPENLSNLEDNLANIRNLAPDKDIAQGIYLYDFEGGEVLDSDTMQKQCDIARAQYMKGLIRDIVILGSPLVGMEVKTVEWCQKWIEILKNSL